MKNYNKVWHLSHIDLDGYSAQIITAEFYKDTQTEIVMSNANYGKSLEYGVKDVLKSIKKGDLFLITDINLEANVAEMIEFHRNLVHFDMQVLDHHETGKNVAKEYDWYHLDTSKCGTRLTYEHFFNEVENEELDKFSNLVNIYDLYKEDEPDFEIAKALNQSLWENMNTFPNILSKYNSKFFSEIVLSFFRDISSGMSIDDAERNIYNTKRKFFLNGAVDTKGSMQSLLINYLYAEIIKDMDIFTSVEIDGKKGLIFFDIIGLFQDISHNVLNKNEDVDFVINVGNTGRLSLRSRKGGVKVDKMAEKYFNGGGHQPASGGTLPYQGNKKMKQDEAFMLFKDTIYVE